MYCAKHPDELVKFHCKDCIKLICIICNGTEHKQHTAETVAEALEYTLDDVRKHQENVKKVILQNKAALNDASCHMESLRKSYDKTENEIDAKYNEVIAKMNNERKHLKDKLARAKAEQLNKIEDWIKTVQYKLKSQENVIALSDTTITNSQNASLLQALQSGVLQNLKAHSTSNPEIPDYNQTITVKFQSAQMIKEHVIGDITKQITNNTATATSFY